MLFCAWPLYAVMYTATCIFCTCASLGRGVPRRIRPEVYTRRYQKLVRQLRCFFRVRSWPFQGGSPPSFSASPCLPWHHHDPIDRILSGFCCRNAQVQRTLLETSWLTSWVSFWLKICCGILRPSLFSSMPASTCRQALSKETCTCRLWRYRPACG